MGFFVDFGRCRSGPRPKYNISQTIAEIWVLISTHNHASDHSFLSNLKHANRDTWVESRGLSTNKKCMQYVNKQRGKFWWWKPNEVNKQRAKSLPKFDNSTPKFGGVRGDETGGWGETISPVGIPSSFLLLLQSARKKKKERWRRSHEESAKDWSSYLIRTDKPSFIQIQLDSLIKRKNENQIQTAETAYWTEFGPVSIRHPPLPSFSHQFLIFSGLILYIFLWISACTQVFNSLLFGPTNFVASWCLSISHYSLRLFL